MENTCETCGQTIAPTVQMGISPRQKDALEAIIRYIKRNDHAPTFAELAKDLSISKSNSHELVMRLSERGRIRYSPGVPRSIAIIA